MENFEKIPSEQDSKLLEMVNTIVDVEDAREKAVLEACTTGEEIQGDEYFFKEIYESAKEISEARDFEKVSLDTILSGYIASIVSGQSDIQGVYGGILERKSFEDIHVLNEVINFQIRTKQPVTVEIVKDLYFKSIGD